MGKGVIEDYHHMTIMNGYVNYMKLIDLLSKFLLLHDWMCKPSTKYVIGVAWLYSNATCMYAIMF